VAVGIRALERHVFRLVILLDDGDTVRADLLQHPTDRVGIRKPETEVQERGQRADLLPPMQREIKPGGRLPVALFGGLGVWWLAGIVAVSVV
jgi:hypothetical protein